MSRTTVYVCLTSTSNSNNSDGTKELTKTFIFRAYCITELDVCAKKEKDGLTLAIDDTGNNHYVEMFLSAAPTVAMIH